MAPIGSEESASPPPLDGDAVTVERLRRAAEAEGLTFLPTMPAATARDALRAVRAAAVARAGRAPDDGGAAWARVEAELDNAVANEGLVLAHVRKAWLPTLPATALRGGAWAWLRSIGEYDERERVCEQWSSLRAHPAHPMARMRVWDARAPLGAREHPSGLVPLSPPELRAWSPEWRPRVAVRLVALRESHAAVFEGRRARELGGARAYVRAHFAAPYAAWEAALRARGLEAEQYVPLPVHPANLPLLRAHHSIAIAEGTLALVPDEAEAGAGEADQGAQAAGEAPAIAATPMMSFRTMLPLTDGEAADGAASRAPRPSLKLCAPVLITSLVRYLSPVEASEGPVLSELLCELVRASPPLSASLALLPEELGVYMWDGDACARLERARAARGAARRRLGARDEGEAGEADATAEAEAARAERTALHRGCEYEEARFVSALFRAPPQRVLGERAAHADAPLHVPLAALLAAPSVGCAERSAPSAREVPLLAELALAHSAGAVGYWRAYCTLVLRAALGLFARYGVALELHQQNSLLQLRAADGWPELLICREVAGGAYIDDGVFAATVAPSVRPMLHGRQDAIVDAELSFSSFFHSTIAMHLLPAGACIAAASRGRGADGLDEARMVRELRTCAAAVLDEVDAELGRLPHALDGADGARADVARAHARAVRERLLHGEQAPRKCLLLMRLLGSKSERFVSTRNPLHAAAHAPPSL
ncbi:hypothetical protein KFE25_005042 [Diacronema lutheri]|uniref:IucA/IucC family siderophore biosynthesis protein n=1 Tax=Diacronema lutheri TaxID=2081491 RepID=A0A8J5X035_DIALT|nr:hypothetical protein KFE25_005042 [Diacronema lutheri]